MEIALNLHAVDFGGRVWAYLYRTAGSFTLIDTGIAGRAQLVLAELKRAGASPADVRRIVATHCHRDHTGNLAELRKLTGAQTYAGRFDTPFIRGDTAVPDPDLTGPERAIVDAVAGGIPDAPPAEIDVELEDRDEINLGATVARVVHLPGHTPGSIALYIPAARILFTGDAIAALGNGPLIVGPFNVDSGQARASLQKLAGLAAGIVCFGHGPPLARDAVGVFQTFLGEIRET